MPDHDLEKLLGGFASDTLTPGEQQQLYRAALTDQQLFNALTDEQSLKELLTDPVVRRRLLQALQATQTTSAVETASWSDWFRRPAVLAWAGGLAAVVFAVILGTRIYEDSVKEAGRSLATEEVMTAAPPASVPSATQPTAPPINEPQLNAQDNVKQATSIRKEAPYNKTAKQKSPALGKLEERRAGASSSKSPLQQHEASDLQRPDESTSDKLAGPEEQTSASTDQQPASAPPTAASLPAPTKIPAAATSGQTSSTLSARSLFYGAGPQSQDKSMAGDTRRREKAGSESAQSLGQSELTPQSLAMAKSKRPAPHQPAGIRYSVSHKEQPEHYQDGAMDAATHAVSLELTVESNQDGYLQLWKHDGASNLQLLFPISETERPHAKLTAHTPLTISVPSTPDMLVIRFSRTDTIPSANFDRTLLDDSTRHYLRESVMTDETSNFPSSTHYVVNQDPSLSEILVYISPSQP
ncbi:MAG: hypothetical protein U0223_17375 [Nitrospira sp.]